MNRGRLDAAPRPARPPETKSELPKKEKPELWIGKTVTYMAACAALFSDSNHCLSWKGGDPAAGSPTATLLRLHPNHESYLGPV